MKKHVFRWLFLVLTFKDQNVGKFQGKFEKISEKRFFPRASENMEKLENIKIKNFQKNRSFRKIKKKKIEFLEF